MGGARKPTIGVLMGRGEADGSGVRHRKRWRDDREGGQKGGGVQKRSSVSKKKLRKDERASRQLGKISNPVGKTLKKGKSAHPGQAEKKKKELCRDGKKIAGNGGAQIPKKKVM